MKQKICSECGEAFVTDSRPIQPAAKHVNMLAQARAGCRFNSTALFDPFGEPFERVLAHSLRIGEAVVV